jgi:amphi-Trp domain-containing protein
LKSIAQAIGKGELTFSDDNGEIVIEPKGLLNLKVSARKLNNEQRLDLRKSWKIKEEPVKKTPLKIK